MQCSQTRWILSVRVSTHAVQIASQMVNRCTNMQPINMELPVCEYASCEVQSVIRFLRAANRTNTEIHQELK